MRLQAPSPGTIQKAKEVLERLPKIIRRAQVTPTQVRDTIGEGGLLQRNAFLLTLTLTLRLHLEMMKVNLEVKR